MKPAICPQSDPAPPCRARPDRRRRAAQRQPVPGPGRSQPDQTPGTRLDGIGGLAGRQIWDRSGRLQTEPITVAQQLAGSHNGGISLWTGPART
jgi:hypothetical protein